MGILYGGNIWWVSMAGPLGCVTAMSAASFSAVTPPKDMVLSRTKPESSLLTAQFGDLKIDYTKTIDYDK